jgi:LacI family transcriptional regulator
MVTPVSGPRLTGIARYAKEHGWNLMVQDRLGYQSIFWHGDGVLATVRPDEMAVRRVQSFRRMGTPVVDLTIDRPDIRLPRVTSDHAALGRLAAEHFAARDFQNTAWFSLGFTHVHALRIQGLTEECRRLGMAEPLRWVYSEMESPKSLPNWSTFARIIARRIAEAPHPLAILTYDESDGARLLAVCREAGVSVPEEVAILSIGNDPILCENQPVTLSSIDQNLDRGGYEAAALLDRLMDGRPAPSQPILVPPVGIVTRRSTDTRAVSDPVLRRALGLIAENLARPYGAEQIADALGLPRFKVDRLFSGVLGRTVGEEIRRQRLAQVKLLLASTNDTLASIARQTGFCHASYLSNTFRREVGMTPRAWRKRNDWAGV